MTAITWVCPACQYEAHETCLEYATISGRHCRCKRNGHAPEVEAK